MFKNFAFWHLEALFSTILFLVYYCKRHVAKFQGKKKKSKGFFFANFYSWHTDLFAVRGDRIWKCGRNGDNFANVRSREASNNFVQTENLPQGLPPIKDGAWRTNIIVCLFGEMTLRPSFEVLLYWMGTVIGISFFRNGIEINQVDSLLFDAPYGQL